MESRKVQRVGTSTLSVSLPKDWARDHGLAKGDIVLLDALQDGSLRVLPQAEVGARGRDETVYVVDADRCEQPGLLGRVVVGSYVIGRDALRITSDDRLRSEHLEEVRSAVSKLLGMGIMAETPREMELQCSLDPRRFPIETVLKRLYTLGSTMQRDAVEALRTRDPELAREATAREDEADRMYWLTIRLLLAAQRDGELAEEIGIPDQLPIVGNRLVARSLEQVADYAEQVALSTGEVLEGGDVPEALVDRVEELSDLVAEIVEDALSSIFLKDLHLANDAIERAQEVHVLEDELVRLAHEEVGDAARVAALRAITWSLRRMAEYGEEIAVIGINRYLERPTDLFHPEEDDPRTPGGGT